MDEAALERALDAQRDRIARAALAIRLAAALGLVALRRVSREEVADAA